MKNIFRTMDSRLGTLLVMGIVVALLALAPWMYGSLTSYFALLDQHMLFSVTLLIGILGLVFYVCMQARRVLHVPYAVSALIFGIAGFTFWNTVMPISGDVYLVLGSIAGAFVVFRRGLLVDNTGSQKTFWKHIFVGVISAVILFWATSIFIGLAFPDLSEALRYSSATILLMMGVHFNSKNLLSMGTVRFAYDMTLLVIFYNFLMFSSRIMPDSLLNIANNLSLYSAAISSTILGILVGLIGAYLLHRHHKIWTLSGEEKNENVYTGTLLAGILALSFLIGANPFLAAGIMGLLVMIRDASSNPENHILSKMESVMTTLVFLVIGASVPLAAFVALAPFGAVVTLFVTVIGMVITTVLLFATGKMSLMPHANIRTYMNEVFNRTDAIIIIGALGLFAVNYLRAEYMLLLVLVIIYVVALEYLYPWVLRLSRSDVIK